jgi:hypothetical protein
MSQTISEVDRLGSLISQTEALLERLVADRRAVLAQALAEFGSTLPDGRRIRKTKGETLCLMPAVAPNVRKL